MSTSPGESDINPGAPIVWNAVWSGVRSGQKHAPPPMGVVWTACSMVWLSYIVKTWANQMRHIWTRAQRKRAVLTMFSQFESALGMISRGSYQGSHVDKKLRNWCSHKMGRMPLRCHNLRPVSSGHGRARASPVPLGIRFTGLARRMQLSGSKVKIGEFRGCY